MRRGICCTACRRRHRKCVVLKGEIVCGACRDSVRQCIFDNEIRFRHSRRIGPAGTRRLEPWTAGPTLSTFSISFATPLGITGDLPGSNPGASANGHANAPSAPPSRSNLQIEPLHRLRLGHITGSLHEDEGINPRISIKSSPAPGSTPYAAPPHAPHNAISSRTGSDARSSISEPCPFFPVSAEEIAATTSTRELSTGASSLRDTPTSTSLGSESPVLAPASVSGAAIPSPYSLLGDITPSRNSVVQVPPSVSLYSSVSGALDDDPCNQLWVPETGVKLTERQAFLLTTYIQELAPNSDACDEARHFALEVPRLSLQEPMILNGILALASLYDSRNSTSTNTTSNTDTDDVNSPMESTYYHSRCLELLIAAFAQPPATWDARLLAAVVIARLYEEYDDNNEAADARFHHLSGAQNLLDHEAVSRFVALGGLAEAASWVHLRQAIYVCLAYRLPVDVRLEGFERSTVFRRTDDSAHANRVVFLFAKVMKLLFPSEAFRREQAERRASAATGTSGDADGDDEEWAAIELEVAEWNEKKPASFRPIYYEAADLHAGRPFPVICIASSVPVVALQHYYAARAIFCLRQCNRNDSAVGFHALRRRHHWESQIATYLVILMALAVSNEHSLNALYLPAHMLSLCGYCIRHPDERTKTMEYLSRLHSVARWKTQALEKTLEEEWADMDRFERR